MTIAWKLAGILLLILANAFFVAGEFALVSLRRTRIKELVSRGSRRAVNAGEGTVGAMVRRPGISGWWARLKPFPLAENSASVVEIAESYAAVWANALRARSNRKWRDGPP